MYLTLGLNQGSKVIKVSNKICRCGFGFSKPVLTVIRFGLQMVWNMLKDNDFKYLGRNVDIVNGLQLIYQGILSFLKNGDNGRLLPVVRESSL
jgi:hypothetical protein